MTGFPSFAARYHKLKRDLQEIEEVEFAKLSERHAALLAQSIDLETTRRHVQGQQCEILDVSRWQDYAAFTTTIARRRDNVVASLNVLESHLLEQRERLRQAYVEQEQWSQIASEEKMIALQEELRREQRETDEEAMKRHRKGGT